MSRWIAQFPPEHATYLAACQIIYRGLLRNGARLRPVGENFEILSGYAFKSSQFASSGVRLLRNINVQPDRADWTESVCLSYGEAEKYERFRLRPGDLVMSMDGPVNKQGLKIAFLTDKDIPALLLQRVCRFDPIGNVERRFLYHILHTEEFLDHLVASNRSIAIPHVSPGQLKAFPIPTVAQHEQTAISDFLDAIRHRGLLQDWPEVPDRLAELRRVVARIGELATQIQEARTLRQHAQKETAQLMAAEERRIWNDDAMSDSKPLVNLTLFLARGKQSEQGQSEHFLIKTQHVQQARYIPTSMRLAQHIAAKVQPDALVRDKDILIACSAAGCLGRVARYRSDGRLASTDTHVAIARPNPDVIDPDYLYAYLRGSQGQHQLRSRERGDWQREKIGFRLTELNLSDLRACARSPAPRATPDRRLS